jgi:hypothetical protein
VRSYFDSRSACPLCTNIGSVLRVCLAHGGIGLMLANNEAVIVFELPRKRLLGKASVEPLKCAPLGVSRIKDFRIRPGPPSSM